MRCMAASKNSNFSAMLVSAPHLNPQIFLIYCGSRQLPHALFYLLVPGCYVRGASLLPRKITIFWRQLPLTVAETCQALVKLPAYSAAQSASVIIRDGAITGEVHFRCPLIHSATPPEWWLTELTDLPGTDSKK